MNTLEKSGRMILNPQVKLSCLSKYTKARLQIKVWYDQHVFDLFEFTQFKIFCLSKSTIKSLKTR